MTHPSPASLVWKSPGALRPHALHKELYGKPNDAASAYPDLRASMKARGFDDHHPLVITTDDRIIAGVTRWAAARSLDIDPVPCVVFQPSDGAAAEAEIELVLITDNYQRRKTELMIAKEQQKLLELQKVRGRLRMGGATDDAPGRSTEKVGKLYGENYKTVERRQRALAAIEAARDEGRLKKAERLTELLNSKQTAKLEAALRGPSPAEERPKKKTVTQRLPGMMASTREDVSPALQQAVWDLVEVLAAEDEKGYAYVRDWLGHLPPTAAAAKELLARRRRVEEGGKDGLPF